MGAQPRFSGTITHGSVLQSNSCSLISEFEISRCEEIKHSSESRQQLAMDEIGLMRLNGFGSMLATISW